MKTLGSLIICCLLFLGLSSFSNGTTIALESQKTFEGVELHWAKAKIDYDYCEIQRSINGQEYFTLDLLDGEKSIQNYFDNAPYEGENFYRVKFVKINKMFDYSQTIKVEYKDMRGLVVAPKIFDGQLQVESLTNHKPNLIRVLNEEGLVVKTFTCKEINSKMEVLTLNCEDLELGNYLVNIFFDGVYKQFKVEKIS